MRLPKLIKEVVNLKQEVASLRQTRSVGVLTSQTTRGVMRRANTVFLNSQTQSQPQITGARWQ